jgi:hypothetical protein
MPAGPSRTLADQAPDAPNAATPTLLNQIDTDPAGAFWR